MQIRDATEADIAAVAGLNTALYAEDAGTRDPLTDQQEAANAALGHFTEAFADDAVRCFVSESDGRVVGYLLGRLMPPRGTRRHLNAELESTYVLPDHRGRGTGAELVRAFTSWAQAAGATTATVTAYAANTAAQRFYARAGFGPHLLTMRAQLS